MSDEPAREASNAMQNETPQKTSQSQTPRHDPESTPESTPESKAAAGGGYGKNAHELIRRQQEGDRVIEAWVKAFGERTPGLAGLILIETLRTMVLATMTALSAREEPVSTLELNRLSIILKRIEDTDKLRAAREEAAKKAATAAARKEQAKKGLSPETVQAMREALLGPYAKPPRTVTSVPVDPWNPAEAPLSGSSHRADPIPPDPGESHQEDPADSHPADAPASPSADPVPPNPAEIWPEIAPRVYRTSPTSILSLGPERGPGVS